MTSDTQVLSKAITSPDGFQMNKIMAADQTMFWWHKGAGLLQHSRPENVITKKINKKLGLPFSLRKLLYELSLVLAESTQCTPDFIQF